MPKETVLDDNSEIYNTKTKQTEKEKLKDMTFKKKISYLFGYYKFHAIGVIVAIALISYILYTIIKPRVDTIMYMAIVDNTVTEESLQELQSDLTNLLVLDPKKEDVFINSTLYFNAPAAYSMSMREVLVTFVFAQDVDIIIAPESEFKNFAYNGFFDTLSDQLPTDLYSYVADSLFMSSLEDHPEENAYGIYVNESDFFAKNLPDNDDPYIIGIVGNSKQKDNAVKTIRYLYGR